MAEKIYIGFTKAVQTKYGEIISISLNPEDRKKLEQYANEGGYTTIKIMNSRNGGKYSEIDTWSLGNVEADGSFVQTKIEPKQEQELDEIDLKEIPW